MPVPQHVLNWLYSILTTEYHDVNRTYNDVAQTLNQHPSLSPRTEVHTFPNGSNALLLHLSGTLPVNFRGNTYRFPLSVWLPHAYPREPPIIYVVPTETMAIRPGQYVDSQGQIYHPYLAGFAEHWDKSSVQDFLAVLSEVFAREPPVVARSQRPPPPSEAISPGSQPAHNQPPPPTTPGSSSGFAPQGHAAPPPPPPKTLDGQSTHSQSPVGHYPSQHHMPSPPPPRPSRYDSAPPLPQDSRTPGPRRDQPRPQPPVPGQPQYLQQAPPSQMVTGGQQPSRSQFQKYPERPEGTHPHDAIPLSPRHDQAQWQRLEQPPPSSSSAYPPWTAGHPPPAQQSMVPPQHQRPPPPAQQAHAPVPRQQPRPPPPPDLMDEPLTLQIPSTAVAAPPIPPNPEKDALLRQLAETLAGSRQHSKQQNDASLAGLAAQRAAMLQAMHSIQAESGQLMQLSSALTSNQNILREALARADQVIEGSRTHPAPNIDELLVAPTVVSNQLYTLVAEERALGDAIFMLGRAVERGKISPAVFSKMTRSLAREWYLKKALVRKIGMGMGLAY